LHLQILVDGLGRILRVPKKKPAPLAENEEKGQQEEPQPHAPGSDDWRVMAQALDRLFFIIYVVLTVILALAFLAR